MTHSQEARVSSSGDFRLGEESRSSVSALVSRFCDSAKMKDQKLQDPFPWMNGFCNLCQAAVGSRNIRHLENLLNVYLENVTPNVKDCYTKPNRAAKLKKSMNDTLIFFHLFYQEIKETLEHSFYLEKMTALVSMFMDMEIKASLRGKESHKKVASRLTSSLYIFLDNSEDHMLDAILMTKFITKNYREVCHPLLWKLLNNLSTYPMHEMLYVRCLLAFKRWKNIFRDVEERKRINKTALQKLHTPPHLMESIKAMDNVLPRIPKTKKNITLFLMQSNFNVKNACQEFLKSLKKPPKGAFNQVLGVEIDKPLFFGGQSGDSSPQFTEKEDESDSGCSNNLINDIWSSISIVESNTHQAKRLNNIAAEKPSVVDSEELPKKKKKKLGKKKEKKQKVVKSVGTKKKKKSSEKSGKQAKKLSKVKGKEGKEVKKKKKKKVATSGDQSQVKTKQAASQQAEDKSQAKLAIPLPVNDDSSQVTVRSKSPVAEEHSQMGAIKADQVKAVGEEHSQIKAVKADLVKAVGEEHSQMRVIKADHVKAMAEENSQIRVIKADHVKPDSSVDEEPEVAKLLKQPTSIQEEKPPCEVSEALPRVEVADHTLEAIPNVGNKSDKSVNQPPVIEEPKVKNARKKVSQVEESDKVSSNQIPSVVEEVGSGKSLASLPKADSTLQVTSDTTTEVAIAKTTQLVNKPDESESKTKAAKLVAEDSNQAKFPQTPPQVDELKESKREQTPPCMEDSDMVDIKQAFLQIGDSDNLKLKQAMLKIGEYDEMKVQKVMEQIEVSEGRKIRQALCQFSDCDGKIREAKIEPQLEIPKTEKCDSPPSAQVQESDLLNTVIEPLVPKVKKEIVNNSTVDSSFETDNTAASEVLSSNVDNSCLPSEKSVDYTKSPSLTKESILTPSEINAKCVQPDESGNSFDNARRDLFSVDSNKDPLSERVLESQVSSSPIILEEGKLTDQKSKTLENITPVSVYAVVEVCDSSLKQEVCDNSETVENETPDANKNSQMDSYSDVEIVEDLRPQGSKCDVPASEDEIVLSDDGDLLTRQPPLDNIFATGNEDLVIEMFGCSERQYSLSRDVLSGESIEFETDNPPVNDDLEPEPSANLSGYETGIVDNYYSKTIKDDNPSLYDSRSLYRIDEWIHYDRHLKSYELDRPVLPSVWMEEEEDDDITESDMSKSFESTPKRGMGKMSYHDAVMSYSRQRELRASTSGRHNSQGCLMMNSSESGSASTEASPLLTSSASGSSSPRSESAIDPVESVHETMDSCDNLTKTSEHGVSSERVPDVSSMSYYHSNYPKSPDIASCTKDVGYNAQISYTPKIGSHRMDNARVVVEPMEHRLLNQAISDRLTASYSRAETSSKRNISETSSQHPPLKRRKSSKSHPEQSVDSRSPSGKRDTEEAGNYAAQSRATLRGRGRRGRPPSRGRGVSSCKVSSDKTQRKHGYSGKGRNDPEFQISSSKKSQPYDPPLTRSISKKFGISETDNMFDRL
ncbi:uncharacterized protein LOC124167545 isoform X2 [Ischnura elegans]|nr:uncharacterized protein LOC124167545 isoform X2 [Ischnura elegans]